MPSLEPLKTSLSEAPAHEASFADERRLPHAAAAAACACAAACAVAVATAGSASPSDDATAVAAPEAARLRPFPRGTVPACWSEKARSGHNECGQSPCLDLAQPLAAQDCVIWRSGMHAT